MLHVIAQTHGGVFVDADAGNAITWERRVVPVAVNRQPVILPSPHCDPPCVPFAWASCPQASAAMVVDSAITLGRPGGMSFLQPCVGTCFGSSCIRGELEEAIRPYANTGTVPRMFGGSESGSVERSALHVTAFEVSDCAIVPAARSTWRRPELRYR